MHPELELAICILNGYPQASRAKLEAAGVTQAHNLYINFLEQYLPRVKIDVLFISDLATVLPSGNALSAYDAYIWTGSDLTIYHQDDPRVVRQIEFSRAIYRAGPPQYGSCWGVQMAAVAAGGEVQKNPRGREWGLARDIQLTPEGQRSPLYAGKPPSFDGFIMHLDEVTRLPAGAKLLAGNEHTPVQAVEVKYGRGTFWATQYHPEYNLDEMAKLIKTRSQALVKEGFFPAPAAAQALADKMSELYRHPDAQELREELQIGDDILTAEIREGELRNWIDHLVIPSLGAAKERGHETEG
ncbi:MAG TPA: type 1 glutamine amidotransferase [Candidatus Fraserbacteria bacterium]|nr:type 1 glutamine amidotransferase [Candidatus Fraserbacteria bacterium]